MKRLFLLPFLLVMLMLTSLAALADPIQGGDKDTVWMRYTPQSAYMVKISHTNKYIAEFGEGYTYFYDFNTGEQIKYLDGNKPGFFINNDQNFLRLSADQMRFEIWDLNTWKLIDTLITNEGPFGYNSNISNDEKLFASWVSGGLRVWDLHSKQTIAFLPISIADQNFKQLWVYQTYFSKDNSKVFATVKKKFSIDNNPDHDFYNTYLMEFDLQKQDSIASFPDGLNVYFSHNTQYYATNYWADDNGVKVFDLNTKQLIWTLPTDGTNCTGMEFSPDDKYLVTVHGPDANVLNVWEMSTGKLMYQIHNYGFGSLDISDDGKYWATTISDVIILWKANYGTTGVTDPTAPIETIYPNPTNSQITLTFTMPSPAITNISITNDTGKTLKTLFNGLLKDGLQKLTYNVSDLPSGAYFVKISSQNYNKIFKLIINK